MKFKNSKISFRPVHWVIGFGFLLGVAALSSQVVQTTPWTTKELQVIRSLSVDNVSPTPRDASNKFEAIPAVIKFGEALFMEKKLSGNDDVSCASCHNPETKFSDHQDLSEGMGQAARHTPSIIGAAYSPYQFWDGRADSLWSQALGPLENPMEHGIDRTQLMRTVQALFATDYEKLFGNTPDFNDAEYFPNHASPLGDETAQQNWRNMKSESRNAVNRGFSNVGKALAAYVRTLSPKVSRFDQYITALSQENAEISFNPDETAGLKLFIGKANCIACHSGALFTDQQFHNTGLPVQANTTPDLGRFEGLKQLMSNEFNCRSVYSDAPSDECLALSKAELDMLEADVTPSPGNKNAGAFKTPSLRNVAETMPLMHTGQFKNLRRVLEHYSKAPKSKWGTSELKPLNLSQSELFQLEQFLETLTDVDTIR